MELHALESALSGGPSRKVTDPIERIFGKGDPITGIIWANPLPDDFRPTPELEKLVETLKIAKTLFVECAIDNKTPEGYKYATYEGSGHYLDQWIQRHTDYQLHHSDYGNPVVFCKKGNLPCYDEDGTRVYKEDGAPFGGVTAEEYKKNRYLYTR
jgi:hypothetical protein